MAGEQPAEGIGMSLCIADGKQCQCQPQEGIFCQSSKQVAEMQEFLIAQARKEALEWSEEDQPLPEDEKIHAAHPLTTGRHDLYAEAMRMVGAKRSKGAIVGLVNWLLLERQEARKEAAQRCAEICDDLCFGVDVRELLTMTKKDMSARACRECAKALRKEFNL